MTVDYPGLKGLKIQVSALYQNNTSLIRWTALFSVKFLVITELPAANTTVTLVIPMLEDSTIIKPNFSLNKFPMDFLENLKALFSRTFAK